MRGASYWGVEMLYEIGMCSIESLQHNMAFFYGVLNNGSCASLLSPLRGLSGKVAAGFCVGGLPGNLRRGQKSRMAQSQLNSLLAKLQLVIDFRAITYHF